jgi:hypothetical protein
MSALHLIVAGMRARTVAARRDRDQNEQPVDGLTGVKPLELSQLQFVAQAVA